jgi:ketosteroid isomerase-like protein
MPRHPELADIRSALATEDDSGVQHYLDQFGEALTRGDAKAIADMWAVPAFVLGAGMAQPVRSREEVEQFFSGARDQYNERGVTDTRAEIVRLDSIHDALVMVRVHWPWLDAQGETVGGECSTYTLERDEDGDWKMRVVVMHGAEALN